MATPIRSNQKIWLHFNPDEQRVILSLSLFSNYLYASPDGIGYFFEQTGLVLSGTKKILIRFQRIVEKGTAFGIFQPAKSDFDYVKLSPVFQRFLLKTLRKDPIFYAAVETAFIRQYEEIATEFRKMLGTDDAEIRRETFELIRFEHANLLCALHLLLAQGRTHIMISSVLRHYYEQEHQAEQWIHLISCIVEKISQEPSVESPDIIIANHDSLANVLMESGKLNDAARVFRQALERCHRLEEPDDWWLKMQACLLNGLANCIQDYGEQLAILEEGLVLAKKTDYEKLIASISFNMSETFFLCNRIDESYALAVEALNFFRKTEDIPSQIKALQSLSTHEQLKKNFAAAEKHLLEAFNLTKTSQNRAVEGLILQELASFYFLQNNFQHAEIHSQAALSIFIETSDVKAQGNAYNLLSAMAFQNNQIEDGMTYAQKAILCFDNVQDLSQMAQVFGNIAITCYQLQWWEEARAELEKALYLYEQSGNDYEMNRWQILLGSIYLQLDEPDHAKAACLQSAAYFKKNKNEEQYLNSRALMRAIVRKTADTGFEALFDAAE